jgi:F-type H+-transporting ATPase subunit b
MTDNASAAETMQTTSSTRAVEGAEHHVDPTALGMNATAWVSLAMLLVIVLMVWKKVPAIVNAMLDKRIGLIRAQLDEASSLRADAEKLRAEYEAKARAAASEAEQLLAHAQVEAEAIVKQAKVDTAALIKRRGKMAEDKIAAAQRTAIAEVRATAANAAASAAASLIAERHDASADKPLVDQAITRLGTTRLN